MSRISYARMDEYAELTHFLKTGSYPFHLWDKLSSTQKKDRKRVLRRLEKNHVLEGATLYYVKPKSDFKRRVILLEEEKQRILKQAHDDRGHMGYHRTLNHVSEFYFWKSLTQCVKSYVQSCEQCQKVNPCGFDKEKSELHPIPVKSVWNHIEIDLITMPTSKNDNKYKYILTVIDIFSKWATAFPISDKKAETIACHLYKLFLDKGFPKIISSDQGREFINDTFEKLTKLNKVEHRVSSAYHPQTQGLVERFNQTLQNMLLKMLGGEDQSGWDVYLDECVYCYNAGVQESTKEKPFLVMYGREPVQLSDATVCVAVDPTATLVQLKEQREILFSNVKANIKAAQMKQKIQYASRRKPKKSFKPGDKVLVFNSRKASRKGSKMQSSWRGLYIIAEVFPKSLYRLKNPHSGSCLEKKVNSTLLKRYVTRSKETSVKAQCKEPTVCEKEKKAENVGDGNSPTCEKLPAVFNPPTISERRNMAKLLCVPGIIQPPRMTVCEGGLGVPDKIFKVAGDGNCYFRALSYLLSGTEENHAIIRSKLVERMSSIEVSSYLKLYLNCEVSKYLIESKMKTLGTWATDAEIIATAHIFKIDIQVFAKYGHKMEWQRYRSDIRVPHSSRAALLMQNFNFHFEPVLSVK